MQDLINEGIITKEAYQRAQSIQRQRGGSLGEILVEMDAVDVQKFIRFVNQYVD